MPAAAASSARPRLPVVRLGVSIPPTPAPADLVRWNPRLSKAFDVTREQFPPRSAEEALVAKFLEVEIKALERRATAIPAVRMGAYLTAIGEVLRSWVTDEIRNLNWRGEETPPQYELIQLNSKTSGDFLVDGMRFLRQGDPDTGPRVTLRVEPAWYGLDVTTYGLRTAGTADTLLQAIIRRAGEINFLKGEAFSLSGEFLPKTEETFDDLVLEPKNATAIARIVSLVNTRGQALENRGVLLMGPPGTGKTLAARIVRNQAEATFIWVSSRDFHYSGSFGGFAHAFDLARECAPSVVVFEDIDNWLSERTVDLIKTEMDGVARSTGVVTMMTTNFPEQLPAALIDRPGRFHDVLKFDLPSETARAQMLRRWLPDLAEADVKKGVQATAGYSGAHVRELARFTRIIAEQESLSLGQAFTSALAKIAEQRDLITATQSRGSRYRMAPAITKAMKAAAPAPKRRAYSVLRVKQIEPTAGGGGRTITGIASTPEPDRMGDIIEPTGVTFANPLPLLLYHDPTRPVGLVTLGAPSADGIPFSATLPDPASLDSDTLRERVKEAIASLVAKLIRGVSIGFRPLNDAIEAIRETGGLRFLETEVLELSLVTIPANVDATVATIKSFDRDRPAVSGTGRPVVTLPGPTGAADRGRPMKNLQEQIKSFEASRQAKSARMVAIMETAGEAGATLNEKDSEEYDGLEADLKSIDAHLGRLDQLEKINKAAARPVAGADLDEASRSRGGSSVITVSKQLPPGIEFARYAMCLLSAKGFIPQAYEIAKARFPDMPRIHTVLKAAVAAGTTTDPTWAGALVDYTNFAGDFIEFLRPATIIGRISGLQRIPFNVRIIGQTSGGSAYWVGEAKPKPLTKFDFAPTALGFAKVANIAVLSDELVRFSSPSAETLVRNALAAAIIERMDKDFIDPAKAAVAEVSPASITNGITAVAHTGTDAAAVRVALAALIGAFIANNESPANAVFIMSSTTALALSIMTNTLGQPEFSGITMNGGTLLGIPVVASQYASLNAGSPLRNIVILANASDIYLADDGQVVIDASREASLQMLDNPTNAGSTGSPAAPVATTMVSLWQNNLLGLRAERFVNWARRRPEAVAWLDNVAWAA